jgi:hypothetical protein
MKRLIAAAALLVAASACGGSGSQEASRPSSPAKVSIAQPQPGARLSGETLEVRVVLTNGTIVDETSRDLTPTTEGHLHVSVDGEILSQTYGLNQELEMPEPGRHLLQVEFVAKDHGPFQPRVIASAPFEVVG